MTIEDTKKSAHAQIDLAENFLLIAISDDSEVFSADLSDGQAINIAAMCGILKAYLRKYEDIIEGLIEDDG